MELTDQIWKKIFGYLDLNDLVDRCSVVNRQWREVVKSISVESLLIDCTVSKNAKQKSDECSLQSEIYEFTYEPINESETYLSKQSYKVLQSIIMTTILPDLRQLLIHHIQIKTKPDWENFEKLLNSFSDLVHLQVSKLTTTKDRTLKLDNIQILSILHWNSDKTLRITAAKLKKVCCLVGFENVSFIYSNNITHLITGTYSEALNQYGNVKYLQLNKDDLSSNFDKVIALITGWNQLKELRLRLISKEKMANLVKKKRVNKNSVLNLYIDDYLVDGQNDVKALFGKNKEIDRIKDETLFKNYDRLSKVVTLINQVDYGVLMQNFKNKLPSDFHSRFVNLKKVSISGVRNCESEFTSFIKRCKVLKHLYINKTSFKQAFYDNLHLYCGRITTLEIEEDSKVINKLNIDFLFNHKLIDNFAINRKIDNYDQVEDIFNNLQLLKSFRFLLKGKKIELGFENTGRIKISDLDINSNDKAECLDALEQFFEIAAK